MAYSRSWSEGTPTGSSNPSTIDEELRNLKLAFRERIEDLLPDWANDGVDPKLVNQSFIQIHSLADVTIFPAPVRDGIVSFGKRERTLQVARSSAWRSTSPLTFTYNPSSPAGSRVTGESANGGIHICVLNDVAYVASTGTYVIDYTEFSGYSLSNNYLISAVPTLIAGASGVHAIKVTTPSTNSLGLTFYNYLGALPVIGVKFYLHLVFSREA